MCAAHYVFLLAGLCQVDLSRCVVPSIMRYFAIIICVFTCAFRCCSSDVHSTAVKQASICRQNGIMGYDRFTVESWSNERSNSGNIFDDKRFSIFYGRFLGSCAGRGVRAGSAVYFCFRTGLPEASVSIAEFNSALLIRPFCTVTLDVCSGVEDLSKEVQIDARGRLSFLFWCCSKLRLTPAELPRR